jgi:peptidoglycan/LPS O-acetylase OafA/YrhL
MLRVYPLYILSILFFYLDASLLNVINAEDHLIAHSYRLDYKYILSNILLIFQDSYFGVGLVNPVAWSLDLELQWYLFAPVLYYFFYYKYNAVYLRISMYLLLLFYWEPSFLNSFTYFLWGILMYDIYLIYQSKFNNLIKMKYLLSFSSILIFSYIVFDLDFLWYTYWLGAALLCLAVNFKSRIDKLLGDLSYPIFVLHMITLPIAFLQVKKYCFLFFGITPRDYFMIEFLIAFILFIIFCYMILLIFQYPLDRLRNIIKSDSQIKDVVIKP